MAGVQKARIGDWVLLFAQVPGQARQPAGILLIDPATDQLHLRLRDDFASSEPGFLEVWQEMAVSLPQFAEDLGGAGFLQWLEDTASNTFTISPRQSIALQSPEAALDHLFECHVRAHFSAQPRAVPLFGDEDLIAARRRLPTSPSHAFRVIEALKNPSTDVSRVEEYIHQDPTLAAHVLKLANAPLYADHRYVGGEIRSVRRAILHLGFDRVVRHLSALVLRKLFSTPGLRQVWNHSIEAAHINRQLCQLCTYPEPDELLLLGLMHDVGQIVLSALGEPYQRAYRRLQQEGIYPVAIERALCGKTHAEIGADLLAAWSFPTDMTEAVRYHHAPSQSSLPVTAMLYLTESWLESQEDVYDPAEHQTALQLLHLTNRDLARLRKAIDPELSLLRLAA